MADREPAEKTAAPVFPGRTEYYGNTPATHAFGDVSHAVPTAASEPRVQPKLAPANAPKEHDYGEPVQEMTTYLAGLKAGRFVFNWAITGEEAAKQLGFTRLFASGYDEIALQAKARAKTQGSVNIGDIISDFQGVVQEEQRIAELMVSRKEYVAVIAYLRALQNGDVVFPGPQDLAPTPPVLLVQLMTAYPDTKFDIDDPVFASVYRQTRVFANARIQEAGEVWAQEIIGEFRRQIIHSASQPAVVSAPTDCERARAVGVLTAVVAQCPGLRLSQTAQAVADALEGRQGASDCLTTSRDKLKGEFGRKPANEIARICGSLERQVQAGKVANLDISH
ncbi:hypothetical protein [Hyphomicrobium denitrificans]|nr:hypothetical protein [Hyphomicrobium denitrificans]